MAEPVDPALRELWNLGGALGSALRALERPGDALKALTPELDEAEQAAEAVLAPLLVQPWAAGASALQRALDRQDQAVAAAETPGGGEVSSITWPPPRPRIEPRQARAEARPAQAGVRPTRVSRFPEPAQAVDAGALERMAALGAEGETSTPHAAGGEKAELPGRRERRAGAVRPASGARAALERRAREAGAGGALHTPVSTRAAGEGRTALLAEAVKVGAPEPTAAPGSTSAGKPGAALDRSKWPRPVAGGARATDSSRAAPPGAEQEPTVGEARTTRRVHQPLSASSAQEALASRAEQEPTVGEARTARRVHQLLSASSAQEALARRAEQAGAGRALETPVNTVAASRERAALLTQAQEPSPDKARRSPLTSATLAHTLERAVARASGPAPGREPERARASVQSAPQAAEPRLEGLAGLAARASPVRSEPPPPALSASAPPQPPIPAVVAERLEETQLARRLQRILRREAEQAGIDLEGLDP